MANKRGKTRSGGKPGAPKESRQVPRDETPPSNFERGAADADIEITRDLREDIQVVPENPGAQRHKGRKQR